MFALALALELYLSRWDNNVAWVRHHLSIQTHYIRWSDSVVLSYQTDKPGFHLWPCGLNLTSTCSLFVFQFKEKKWLIISESASWLDIMHSYQYVNYATTKIWNSDVNDNEAVVQLSGSRWVSSGIDLLLDLGDKFHSNGGSKEQRDFWWHYSVVAEQAMMHMCN